MVSSASSNGGGGGPRSSNRRISNSNRNNSPSNNSNKSPRNNNSRDDGGGSLAAGSRASSKARTTRQRSPLSVLEQWQRDAKGAVEDAYANYVLGDDTGESARLVLVSNPFDDILTLEQMKKQQHPPHELLNNPHSNRNSNKWNHKYNQQQQQQRQNSYPQNRTRGRGAPSTSQLLVSHREYYTDANYNSEYQRRMMMGATNGLKDNTNNKSHPHSTNFASCGVTYVEINGRAYVHEVEEASNAYRVAGIRAKDCVQYAAVLAKEWEDPLGGDFDIISTQAMEREESGQRITYEELKRVFLQGSGILSSTSTDYQQATQAQQAAAEANHPGAIMGPSNSSTNSPHSPVNIPSTIRIGKGCGATFIPHNENTANTEHEHDQDQDTATERSRRGGRNNTGKSSSHNSNNEPRPVVLVFRRTKQRPPKVWNVWPNYRLDDECDVACQILHSLTTSSTTTTSPSTSRNSPNSKGSNQRNSSPRKRHHRNNNRRSGRGGDDDDFFDDEESTMLVDGEESMTDFSRHRSNRGCSTGHRGGCQTSRVLFSTDDTGGMQELTTKKGEEGEEEEEEEEMNEALEASTIRGMIQKAVGLAFVRSNKVVFGVSVSGGSGIVLSRLSDGTWSAPSLIGMAGMGFGIQIGVEVANYIFILQSKEALEHFQRGGSFTLGGNVGLAFAGMFEGREAIGAASVSSALCGLTPIHAPPIKEDEYNYDTDHEEEELMLYQMMMLEQQQQDNNEETDDNEDNDNDYDIDTHTGRKIRKHRSTRNNRNNHRGSSSRGGGGTGGGSLSTSSRTQYQNLMNSQSACGRVVAAGTSCGGGGSGGGAEGGSGSRGRGLQSAAARRYRRRMTTGGGMSSSSSKEEKKHGSGGSDNTTVSSLLLESGAGVAPIVAYAKSEGLYVGVSLEGSRIFTRNDMNARAYKYSSYNHKQVTARDILTGKIVSRPYEAERLYSLLHHTELTHEISCLPALPNSTLLFQQALGFSGGHGGLGGGSSGSGDWTRSWEATSPPYLVMGDDGETTVTNTNTTPPATDTQTAMTTAAAAAAATAEEGIYDLDKTLMQDDIHLYHDKFQDFLFGGITVLRISSSSSSSSSPIKSSSSSPLKSSVIINNNNSNHTIPNTTTHKREQRTLWLQSGPPGEARSVRIGFVSKLYSATAQRKHLSASIIQDGGRGSPGSPGHGGASVMSEMDGDELTLDSALMDNQSLLTTTGTLQERVELSQKLSMDLVDVLSLTIQKVPVNTDIRFLDNTGHHGQEEVRGGCNLSICLESLDVQLVFVGRTVEETRLLFCGLKILLEKETARIGIRGGQGTGSSTGKNGNTRRTKKGVIVSSLKGKNTKMGLSPSSSSLSKHYNRKNGSGYASSDNDETDDQDQAHDPSEYYHTYGGGGGGGGGGASPSSQSPPPPQRLPEGWKSWGRVPGRSYMRAQSASTDDGYPTYVHGQLLIRDVCKSVILPLPLPLCRVLLLDSSSPVISKWENERGDMDFERTPWTFPPATPREMEQFQSEHQLIASGSMCGAHRTISYERYRNGQPVRLSETHIVDSDDSEKLAFQVNERLPRRGFSIKVKLLLRGVDNGSGCEATVLGEIRPVGKNMSDPAAVHKALLKVMDELRNRYGTNCVGLLAGFMHVVENMPKEETNAQMNAMGMMGAASPSSSSQWRTNWEEKKEHDHHNGTKKNRKPLDRTSVVKFEDVMNADLGGVSDIPQDYSKFAQERRPNSTTSAKDYKSRGKSKARAAPVDDTFNTSISDPVTIEVKPLPKIRLSLMPSPREEDEEHLDDDSDPSKGRRSSSSKGNKSSKSKSSSSKSSSKRSAWGKKKKSRSSNSGDVVDRGEKKLASLASSSSSSSAAARVR